MLCVSWLRFMISVIVCSRNPSFDERQSNDSTFCLETQLKHVTLEL